MITNIHPDNVDFTALVTRNNSGLKLDFQTKMIDYLKDTFTDKEQKWYIANFYVYLHYDPINDYPINLDNIYKMLGFQTKGNAKKALKNNFTIEQDYKEVIMHKDKNSKGGRPEMEVMLNVDTFKTFCMLIKTDKGKDIRKYYIKLENIFNKITKDQKLDYERQIEEQQKVIELKKNENQILEIENEESKNHIALLTKKTDKFKLGDSVYIFKQTFEDNEIYKLGKTKNANERDLAYKTASLEGIIEQISCVNCHILEKVVHFLLDKYRIAKRREWFDCTFSVMRNAVEYAKMFLENDLFENINYTNELKTLQDNFNGENVKKNVTKEEKEPEQEIFTEIDYISKDINNFDLFIEECFEIDEKSTTNYDKVKAQYKIWSKVGNNNQCMKCINFFKTKFKTVKQKYNPIAIDSKMSNFFTGIGIKQKFFEFNKPKNDNYIIEKFLYERFQRAPRYRVGLNEVINEFKSFFGEEKTTILIEKKLKDYLDKTFIRSRKYDSKIINKVDTRLTGWLGLSLKTNNEPGYTPRYNPSNAINIKLFDMKGNLYKEFPYIYAFANFIGKSTTVTSGLVSKNSPIIINGQQYNIEKSNSWGNV